MLQNSKTIQPKVVVIRRRPNQGFGFTLRHFIAYPPEDDPSWPNSSDSYHAKAMETIFIKEVQPNGPAHFAGLQTGDRVLMVNNIPIAGVSYSLIVSMIKQTPTILTLHVVPKECDVLQMHYTIAHTPESNRLTGATKSLSNSSISGAIVPISTAAGVSQHKFLHPQMISYPTTVDGLGSGVSGSSTSRSTNNSRTTAFLTSNDYKDLHFLNHRGTLLMRGDGGVLRSSKSTNLSVFPRQPQLQQHPTIHADTSDLMIRLRESIKQKEEFLKSPLPNTQPRFFQHSSVQQFSHHKQPHFSIVLPNDGTACSRQVKALAKQPLPITRDLLPASCDMQNFYAKNLLPNFDIDSIMNSGLHDKIVKATTTSNLSRNHRNTTSNSNNINISGNGNSGAGINITDKFHKELEYLESLPEMGVTNQVFERKLVTHMAKGFDPFKPLSINTNAADSIVTVKKSTPILFNTVQNNQNLSMQQQQQLSNCVVDGQQSSRMEVHKANATSAFGYEKYQQHIPSTREYALVKPNEFREERASLADIAETNDIQSISASLDPVIRRYKPATMNDDNKPMRRISYLRATNNENEYHSDSTTTTTTTPTIAASVNLSKDTLSGVGFSGDTTSNSSRRTSVNSEIRNSVHIDNVIEINGKIETKDAATEMEVFETEMEVKSSCVYGKRMSEYRSWRQAKIEIKGDILKIYSSRNSKSDSNVIVLDIRNFNILDESADKKKYMFRLQSKPRNFIISNPNELILDGTNESSDKLTSSGSSSSTSATTIDQQLHTEIVFKTKSITEMKRIFCILQEKCNINNSDSDLRGKQLAEPQKTAATASMPTITYCDDSVQHDCSPQSSTSRGELESESISPIMKSRKSSHTKNIPEKDLGSPKAKNWKDLLFRRNHGANSADISPSNLSSTSKTTGSIGVPLKTCPMSKDNEFLPHIVDVCTNIVETKGLGVVGIYRIPGNKAAISELRDQVNKNDFTWDRCNADVRWEDVNVVSSLLKLFIRSLPDALLPTTFYSNFIEADKKVGIVRLKELKELLESLPRYSYETMKHLIRHLSRVSKNCQINLMEPKNLAIIFGPSIIRTPNDTLEIAVKDMKHQCRIVELLVTQYDYFFENGPEPEISEITSTPITMLTVPSSNIDQTTLLLDNVSKIERINDRESLTSRFIPHLRRRTHSKRSAVSSDTYSGESVLSLDYKKLSIDAGQSLHQIDVEKDTGSGKEQRSSVDISLLLTDDESSNSRISDSGSMSLTTITDTLDSKLRNLRSGSESNDENGSPNLQSVGRRHTFAQPLILHENIPYADESPERHQHVTDSGNIGFSIDRDRSTTMHLKNFPMSAASRNLNFSAKNIRFSSVYEQCSDDSEGSTTSDPKEAIIISTPFFLERYNKKRRDHRLFRSASFNCRNYSTRVNNGGSCSNNSALTKDEKTDMNLTKKRQIQNKQNRSIKRRHTVGGPHDYSTSSQTTTVLRRIPIPSANGNINNNHNGTNQSQHNNNNNNHNNNNGDHVLEVGIRIKNVNRRY